jgi:iron complex outermembrane receptor protein
MQEVARRWNSRATRLVATLLAAFALTASPLVPAVAAGASGDTMTEGLAEVVVTARKVAEDLQVVPIAITAFTSADLQRAGVQDLRDLTFMTPGLTFTEGAGANYFSKPIIRGQTDIGGSGDNNVPVFLDGIYISNTSAIDLGLVDLDRVEVVKGPVSALYGRSAYAGAINYISAKPTDEYKGYAEATLGDYNKINERIGASGPLIEGILKGGFSGSLDRFDGTYHDPVTDQNAGGYDKKDVMVNFDYTPNDIFEVRPVLYFGDDNFAASPVLFGPANCSVGAGYGYSQSFCGRVPDATFQGPYIAPGGEYGQTGNSRKVFLTSLNASAKYDWGMITSLTGYDSIHSNEYSEFDDQRYGLPQPTYYLPPGATVGTIPANPALLGALPTGQTALVPEHFGYTDRNNDISEELRFTSPLAEAIRYSVGGYFALSRHYEDLNLAQGTCGVPEGQYIITPFATPCGVEYSPQQTVYTQSNKIFAEFVSLDWDIVKDLTLSVELRNTSTQSSYRDLYAIFDPNPYALEGYSTSGASTPNPIGDDTLSKTFHDVTSRESLSYHITSDTMVYASAANGEKVGGFNNNIDPSLSTYQPETNWTYEAGVKTTFLDRRAQVNADVFYISAKNYQIYGPPPGASTPGNFITTNYGGLATKGVEVSGLFAPVSGVKVSMGVAYVDPKFKSNAYDFGDVTLCAGIASCAGRIVTVGPNQAVSLYGLRPPYESNFTANIALDLKYRVYDSWNWIGRIDDRYESKQYYQYPIDTGYFGPKNIMNLRTGVDNGTYSFVVYVRNATDDKTPETVQDAAVTSAPNFEAGYFPIAVLPEGRNYGATFRYNFGR